MKTYDEVLATEYSEDFDKKRKDAMVMGFYNYGPIAENQIHKLTDLRKSIDTRLQKFDETRNTDFLVDVANFCMGIYMFPQSYDAHYQATDSSESPGLCGMSTKEIERFMQEEGK